jgi:hypothetical protein
MPRCAQHRTPIDERKSLPSNQENLMGKMKTNGQRRPARGGELPLGDRAFEWNRVVQERHDESVQQMCEQTIGGSACGDVRAGCPLARLPPMPVVIRLARKHRAVSVQRGRLRAGRSMVRAVASVRVMYATAHHQMDHKHRGG